MSQAGAPDVAGVLGSWTFSPILVAAVVLASLAYAAGVRRLRGRGRGWPARRSAAAAAAVVVLVVAVDGPVGVWSHVLSWEHMIQHLALIMVVPVLLVWAQPVRLLAEAGPACAVDAVLAHPVTRAVTHPLVALGVYTAVLVLTHLTGFPARMTGSAALHDTELLAYVVSGYLLFWPLAGDERSPWAVPYPLRLALMALAMGADTLVGVALMLTGHPLSDHSAMHPGWGLDALADQHTAGGIMWAVGDGLMMLLMILVGLRWGLERPENQTMGTWLEGARARTVLGDDGDGGTEEGTVDDEDAVDHALARYNARLAALHGLDRRRRADDT